MEEVLCTKRLDTNKMLYVLSNICGNRIIWMRNKLKFPYDVVVEYSRDRNILRLLSLGYSIYLSIDLDYNNILSDIKLSYSVYSYSNRTVEDAIKCMLENVELDIRLVMKLRGVSNRVRNIVHSIYPALKSALIFRPDSSLIKFKPRGYKLDTVLNISLTGGSKTGKLHKDNVKIYKNSENKFIGCRDRVLYRRLRLGIGMLNIEQFIYMLNNNELSEYNKLNGTIYTVDNVVGGLYFVEDINNVRAKSTIWSTYTFAEFLIPSLCNGHVIYFNGFNSYDEILEYAHMYICPLDIFFLFTTRTEFLFALYKSHPILLSRVEWLDPIYKYRLLISNGKYKLTMEKAVFITNELLIKYNELADNDLAKPLTMYYENLYDIRRYRMDVGKWYSERI